MRINSSNYPLVSVIMNCYNGESYLAEAVKSILDQTYKNFEVIFWDNQSKAKSAVAYKHFKDKRLKYYYKKKLPEGILYKQLLKIILLGSELLL